MSVDLNRLIELLESRDDVSLAEFARALLRAGNLTINVPDAPPTKRPVLVWDIAVVDVTAQILEGDSLLTHPAAPLGKQSNATSVSSCGSLQEFFRLSRDHHDTLVTVNGIAFLYSPYLILGPLLPDEPARREWSVVQSWEPHPVFSQQLEAGDQIVFRAARIELEDET